MCLCVAGGRYLGDMWMLALDTLTWTPISGPAKSAPPTPLQNGDAAEAALLPVSQPLLPCAGHAMVAWGSKLLVVGGHMKVNCNTPFWFTFLCVRIRYIGSLSSREQQI